MPALNVDDAPMKGSLEGPYPYDFFFWPFNNNGIRCVHSQHCLWHVRRGDDGRYVVPDRR